MDRFIVFPLFASDGYKICHREVEQYCPTTGLPLVYTLITDARYNTLTEAERALLKFAPR